MPRRVRAAHPDLGERAYDPVVLEHSLALVLAHSRLELRVVERRRILGRVLAADPRERLAKPEHARVARSGREVLRLRAPGPPEQHVLAVPVIGELRERQLEGLAVRYDLRRALMERGDQDRMLRAAFVDEREDRGPVEPT